MDYENKDKNMMTIKTMRTMSPIEYNNEGLTKIDYDKDHDI